MTQGPNRITEEVAAFVEQYGRRPDAGELAAIVNRVMAGDAAEPEGELVYEIEEGTAHVDQAC